MKHKWDSIIKAYADGYAIQYRNVPYETDWTDILEGENCDSPNFNLPNFEWRVKPEGLNYRVAIFYNPKNYHYYSELCESDNPRITDEDVSSHPNFVQWLTDWVEFK